MKIKLLLITPLVINSLIMIGQVPSFLTIKPFEKKVDTIIFNSKKQSESKIETLYSINSNKRRLDSLVERVDHSYTWELHFRNKHEYMYNEKGFVIMDYHTKWDRNQNLWEQSSKTIYSYDILDNLILEIGLGRFNDTSARKEYTYDSFGNIAEYKWFSYSESGAKFLLGKYEQEFDINRNRISFIEYWTDLSLSNECLPYSKIVQSYDANNNEIEYIRYEWRDDEWNEYYRISSSYNKDNQPTEIISEQSWHTEEWRYNTKIEYEYNNDGLLSRVVKSDYHIYDPKWELQTKTEYAYQNNKQTTQLDYRWDTDNAKWNQGLRINSYYPSIYEQVDTAFRWNETIVNWDTVGGGEIKLDDFGNTISVISKSWDSETGALVNSSKMESPYTDYNEKYQMIHCSWNVELEKWHTSQEETYYYSEKDIVDIDENIKTTVKLYPNPFSNQITITCQTTMGNQLFKLYSSSGRLIFTKSISDCKTIDLSNLNCGIYFYSVCDEKSVVNGKLIKE